MIRYDLEDFIIGIGILSNPVEYLLLKYINMSSTSMKVKGVRINCTLVKTLSVDIGCLEL